MSQTTDRLNLPLLATAQAQKEMTHNEALALVDILLQPVVISAALSAPPASPVAGQCWIVGVGAGGSWTGRDGAIAAWTAGGWRFVSPIEGMQVWSQPDGVVLRRLGSTWTVGALTAKSLSVDGNQVVGARGAAIAAPTGGGVVDVQCRAAVSALLSMVRTHGLIAP
jgi:hypothetical protein